VIRLGEADDMIHVVSTFRPRDQYSLERKMMMPTYRLGMLENEPTICRMEGKPMLTGREAGQPKRGRQLDRHPKDDEQ
jgi:hypothetical protein